jgi:hypothetical protein
MMRELIVCSIALLVSAATCVTPSYLRARAPLTHPVDTACIKRQLAAFAGQEAKKAKRWSGLNESSQAAYRVDSGGANIAQVIRRDSGAFLETSYQNIQQIFTGERGDSAFDALATLLLGARDSCGGRAPSSGRELVVITNAPTYEGWLVSGTNARVSVKRVSDTYRVQVDTIARRRKGSPAATSWVQVERSELRRIPKGYDLVTDCSPRDSLPDGGVVALARASKKEMYTDFLHVWRLDSLTQRFGPDSSGNLVCRTPVQGAD